MKKIFYIFTSLLLAASVCSCSEDKLSDTSIVKPSINAENDFDKWLKNNYLNPYNIDFKYKFEDIESDMTHELVPAKQLHSQIIAKLIKHLWIDAYTEVTNVHFMRYHAPRVMMTVGSAAWNTDGTWTLGTAEGGLKITLYMTNWIDKYMTIDYDADGNPVSLVIKDLDTINHYFLHVIHHEFGHILNQKKKFSTDFNLITAESYSAQWNSLTNKAARELGFVSPYASSAPGEDFVEILAFYLTLSDTDWKAILTEAGSTGADLIIQKLLIVKSYMKESWDIDLGEMRSVLARRYSELPALDWFNLND